MSAVGLVVGNPKAQSRTLGWRRRSLRPRPTQRGSMAPTG